MKRLIGRTLRKRSVAGFTLLEILVVIIIVAVLAAIAAPSWNALMNRQRVNAVRDEVVQVIRQAQADARRSRVAKLVVFNVAQPDSLQYTIQSQPDDPATGQPATVPISAATITNWQTLGQGNAGQNIVEVLSPGNAQGQVLFNSNGAVDGTSPRLTGVPDAIFSVTVRQKNTSSATNRCVVVATLLGSTRLASGTDCPS
uniref:Prepilin-type N-terminal cleavage/methylation domain-containing protein n=1 Tax=Oscillatoriales cyanobacterium SpSt-402 TaxID=2282168 RepID=A0A832H9X4_9CYAN